MTKESEEKKQDTKNNESKDMYIVHGNFLIALHSYLETKPNKEVKAFVAAIENIVNQQKQENKETKT